jgi:hypothetical protein
MQYDENENKRTILVFIRVRASVSHSNGNPGIYFESNFKKSGRVLVLNDTSNTAKIRTTMA